MTGWPPEDLNLKQCQAYEFDGFVYIQCDDGVGARTAELNVEDARKLRDWLTEYLKPLR